MQVIPLYQDKSASDWLAINAPTSQTQSTPGECERDEPIEAIVKDIIDTVGKSGDRALADFAVRFNDPQPRRLAANAPEVQEAIRRLPTPAKQTLEFAAERIRLFAEAIMKSVPAVTVQFDEYNAGMDFKPVARAACYVPGGRYPLPSTALMTTITARAAGVKEIAVFSPVLNDEILCAGVLGGATEFYEIGGAQAIAAAAFGTSLVKPVDVIVGPGNTYVTEAKRQLQGRVGIDMLAGPSEIAVIADGGANPEWVCLDLLSQAEHDPDARSYLLTFDSTLADRVSALLPTIVESLKLPEFVRESLSKSAILLLPSIDDCIAAANAIAPEHLLLQVVNPADLKDRLTNYGALFMGYCATVPYGDYAAGPNHTLPTSRRARFSGGLSPLTFLRAQSWLAVPAPARILSEYTSSFAQMEGLKAHEAAATIRTKSLATANRGMDK